MATSGERNWLVGLFVENGSYKLLSLALVIIVYSWIMGEQEAQTSSFTNVRLIVPETLVLTSPTVDRVKVTVQGRRSAITAFNRKPMEPIMVNLNTKSTEDDIVRLTPDLLKLPSTVRVVSIQPSFLRIELKKKASKVVPIRARMIGEPPVGYQVSKTTIEPDESKITGPENVIKSTRIMITDPIDVSGKKATFTENVRLRHDDPAVQDNLNEPVKVTVTITSRSIDRGFNDVSVLAANTSQNVEIHPKTLTLTLRGPQEVLKELDPKTIMAYVDMADAQGKTGVFVKKVQIQNIPKGTTLTQFNPTHFRVTIKPAKGAGTPAPRPAPRPTPPAPKQ